MNAVELAVQADVTYKRIDYWIRCGYIKPIAEARPGTGHVREFTYVQVQVCLWMARLVKVGFTPAAAAKLATSGEARNRATGALMAGWGPTTEQEASA